MNLALKRELKIWSMEQFELLPVYRKIAAATSQDKIKSIFENIYSADLSLKSTGGNKFTKMFSLINNICGQ
ncbi:MAG: hypothetical protein IPM96_13540 [Ignavibacteria bacterium]|nr:hypothetical protein [Ignavibacteria bacterium]